MSADNGIYIAKFPDGFRVCHAQAIENIDFFPEGSKERKEELKSYFGESNVYTTQAKATAAAFELEEFIGYLEYGVGFIGEYESFE